MRALGWAERTVAFVAGEVATQELLGAAGVGVAARQRDALLQQPLGEHQSTAVEGDKKPIGKSSPNFLVNDTMNRDVFCYTGISSQIGTKLRDWAVVQAGAGCYSQAALSSNDSKTR